MRTFAKEQNHPQQRVSSSITRLSTAAAPLGQQAHRIVRLQRTLGNQAVPRLLQAKPDDLEARSSTKGVTRFAHDFSQIPGHIKSPASVHAELTVSPPRYIYEQEADRVSEQVMSMPEPQLQRVCDCGGGCPKCQTEQSGHQHERLWTKRVQSSDLGQSAAPPIVHEVLDSPGQPLDVSTRAFMEPRFGHDFSRVRVHTDAKATESAQAVKAAAYTVGRDIVFDQNHYDPHSAPGRFLLVHELAHTFQQGQAGGMSAADRAELQIGAPNDRSEAEADDVAAWLFSPFPDNGATSRPRVSNTKPVLARFDCSRLDFRNCRTGVYKCGYGDSGTCGWVGPTRGGCICVGALKPPVPPVPVPERATQEARVRVRVRGAHPYFEDYANRLPYMEAPPGREFIVVIGDGIFKQVVIQAEALRIQQTKRLLRPADPRNIPFIQVEPVLIGGAVVAAFVAIPLLAVLLAPAIVSLVGAAAAAVASAASAATAAVGTGASWGVATVTKAVAAGIVVRLVAGGMRDAEAAEAVKPLIGKPVLALADVTEKTDMANAKPGQEISVEGQTFRAIIRLTTGG